MAKKKRKFKGNPKYVKKKGKRGYRYHLRSEARKPRSRTKNFNINHKKGGVKMARKVFFSFHYERDAWRVSQVRNCNVVSGYEKNPFYDKADWEKIKRRGYQAIKNWIEEQLSGTTVTVVLIGKETSTRPWVRYEIKRSVELGKGLIGIDISKIKDQYRETDDTGSNPLPTGYKRYLWNNDNGRENLGAWIEKAAQDAGK